MNLDTNALDLYYMKQAYKEALLSLEKDEVPIGAIIVCGNEIIGKGHNMVKTLNDQTAHAEILAITAASSYLGNSLLEECKIYVTVEPCAMCAGAIKWSRLATLYYATSEPKHGFTLYKPNLLHPKTKVIPHVLQAECAQLMVDFFKSKRS